MFKDLTEPIYIPSETLFIFLEQFEAKATRVRQEQGSSEPWFMPCLLSSGFDSLYCLGTAPAHIARSNALGSLNTR
jgi:hypothetical protein